MLQDYEYINKTYGKNFKRRMKVVALGRLGIVTGTSGCHIVVKLDEQKFGRPYHPSDVVPWVEDIAGGN